MGRRWKKYLAKNKNGKYIHVKFANAILKYGWDAFEHEILFHNCSRELAYKLEMAFIKYYKDNQLSYNITDGGQGANYGKGYGDDDYELRKSRAYKENHPDHWPKYYAENKEKLCAYQKRYREENAEKCKERSKRYQETHKEELKAHHKKYAEEHKDQRKEYARQYYLAHKEEINRKNRENYHKHSDERKAQYKEYRERNKEKLRMNSKHYREENRDVIRERKRLAYQKKKQQELNNE